jgi:hypothetical protein
MPILPNHLYPIPRREPLIWITRNSRIHCGVPNRDTSRGGNYPPYTLIRAVPHLYPEREVCAGACFLAQLPPICMITQGPRKSSCRLSR